MGAELREPSVNPQASIEHERATLSDRIPPAAPVPPTGGAQHPSSIALPTAMTHRDQRAADNRAVEDERRRADPFGQGRTDVDWLGRATGPGPTAAAPPTPTGPVAQPLGVHGVLPSGPEVLPSAQEPPSFTELLRLQGADDGSGAAGAAGVAGAAAAERPFDWAIRDDETGEVPATLTTDSFDTTAFGAGSWSLADESDDDVVSGEVDTPPGGFPLGPVTPASAAAPAAAAPGSDESPAAERPFPAPVADEPHVVDRGDERWPADEPDDDHDDHDDQRPGADARTTVLPAAPPVPAAAEPAEPAPPLVEPEPAPRPAATPADHLPWAAAPDQRAAGEPDQVPVEEPDRLPATAPDDLDQSEWDGRETSDTGVIKDLFGTEAVQQLDETGYDPEATGTRMMPAVVRPDEQQARRAVPAEQPSVGHASGAGAPGSAASARGNGSTPSARADDGDRDNFINEGVARLRSEGKRGKQLLIGGSIVLIALLLVAVFALTRWILGGSIDEQRPAATSSAAASAPATPATTPEAAADSAPAEQPAATLRFATTQAGPGVHTWTDLAGGECLTPYTNAWADSYTVVDCSTPHTAQLTARVQVEASQWPGPDALAAQAAKTCQTAQAIDTAAAAKVGDVQVQGAYAPDQTTWDQGNTFISCFATRSSGDMLTGSLAPSGK